MANPSQKFLKVKRRRKFYNCRSLFGNDWALFYILMGGRGVGKSYSVMDFCIKQFLKYGRVFYWLRLTEDAKKELLANNAEKLIEGPIGRKYNLDLETSGENVYLVTKRDDKDKVLEKKLMCRVMALSTHYKSKGQGLFDHEVLNDPNYYFNIVLDEMNKESGERRTFDILYAFVGQLQTIARDTDDRMRVIMIGNTIEEASDICSGFDFIPNNFGRYYLVRNKKILYQYLEELRAAKGKEKDKVKKKYKDVDFGKRCIIDYIMESDDHAAGRQHGTSAILAPKATTFTNEIINDCELLNTTPLIRPDYLIKFGKTKDKWFVVWDGRVIKGYKKEKGLHEIPMLPYISQGYNKEEAIMVRRLYFEKGYLYHNLLIQKTFTREMKIAFPK